MKLILILSITIWLCSLISYSIASSTSSYFGNNNPRQTPSWYDNQRRKNHDNLAFTQPLNTRPDSSSTLTNSESSSLIRVKSRSRGRKCLSSLLTKIRSLCAPTVLQQIWVVGDLHGDYESGIHLLQNMNIIDESLSWITLGPGKQRKLVFLVSNS